MKALPSPETTLFPILDPETYNDARIVAPGYDVYYLEQEWRAFWFETGKPELGAGQGEAVKAWLHSSIGFADYLPAPDARTGRSMTG
jgi:hypothetical protein